MVGSHPRIVLHDIPTNDAWTRDHGPIFLTGPGGEPPALVDFGYNAWGGKYPPFDLDDQVPRRIAEELRYRRFEPGIVLEGGSIDGNGRGTVLTTEQCLLNPNRNPGLGKQDVERVLRDYLGIMNVLWLGSGIEGDDTDGHIDELARFVGPSKVVAAVEDDPSDVNHGPLRENFERLKRMKDEAGKPLDVIPVPMPRAHYFRDQRLPCSYMNFYIANGLVILPFFGDPRDESIWTLFVKLFPDRRVVGMDAIDLVWGLGGFHCVTQQQPS
jgi:agmatine deiminase